MIMGGGLDMNISPASSSSEVRAEKTPLVVYSSENRWRFSFSPMAVSLRFDGFGPSEDGERAGLFELELLPFVWGRNKLRGEDGGVVWMG